MTGRLSLGILIAALLEAVSYSTVFAFGPLTTDPAKMNREWIGIGPGGFSGALTTLRDFRISQGHSACVWTLDELDASYGGHSPSQLRQALQDAFANWTTKPKWVLIASDVDLKLATPCYSCIDDWALYNPELGHWEDYIRGLWPYMDLNEDGAPEIAVGRVPAQSAAELSLYVTKIVRHDQDVSGGSGYLAATLLECDADVGGRDGAWARSLGDSLYTYWMPASSKTRYRLSELCSMGCQRDSATAAWNRGPGICVAFGTSSNWLMLSEFWNVCQTYFPWSVEQLAATHRYPAVLGISCGVTATDHPLLTACEDSYQTRPLAEQLLLGRSDAGASVIIGPTRNTYQYYDFLLGKHLLTRYYARDHTWGEVFTRAMQAALAEDPSSYDHVYQYVLEGDPAALANAGGALEVPSDPARVAFGLPAPNPALRSTQLSYSVPRLTRVRLTICDVAGRRIRSLVDRDEPDGAYTATWDLRDEGGVAVGAGAYFLRLQLGHVAETRRIVVIH